MSMTTRQFNEAIDMLLGRIPLDMLDSKQQEGLTRVFVAAGFLMEHRLKLAEETDACFIVCDHNGQALAYVYFEEEPGRRAAAKLLTRDEAWRIAVNIAKLPGLLKRS